MKHLSLIVLILGKWLCGLCQENPASLAVQTTFKVKALQEKKAEYHKRTNGESDGYRVKIHFGADKSKAREAQSKFTAKYVEIPAYEEYQQPNFVINVGDFKTKLEAYELLKHIKADFPYAFIVKSKIRPMKLVNSN